MKSPHVASLVFLHGLGDTGFGWAGALNQIKPEFLKVWCRPSHCTLDIVSTEEGTFNFWALEVTDLS